MKSTNAASHGQYLGQPAMMICVKMADEDALEVP